MAKKEDYIKEIESSMEKYKGKISKIDKLLENYKAENKSDLVAQRQNLKERFEQGEKMLQQLKSSSEEGYEKIKENAVGIFEGIKDAFYELSHFLTMDQLSRTKDEMIDLGNEKVEEIQNFIKEHPMGVAAWALGIGFLVGTLYTRSK